MDASILQFGTEVSGCDYVLRPGSYGVIRNEAGGVAVVFTPLGVSLPGGGRDDGESDEAALIRETAEECGLRVRITRRLGVADELVFGAVERRHYRKRGTFFVAEWTGEAPVPATEPDHQLAWVSAAEATARLFQLSHQWALGVSQAAV